MVLDIPEDVTAHGRRRVPGGVLPSAPRWEAEEGGDGVWFASIGMLLSLWHVLAVVCLDVVDWSDRFSRLFWSSLHGRYKLCCCFAPWCPRRTND